MYGRSSIEVLKSTLLRLIIIDLFELKEEKEINSADNSEKFRTFAISEYTERVTVLKGHCRGTQANGRDMKDIKKALKKGRCKNTKRKNGDDLMDDRRDRANRQKPRALELKAGPRSSCLIEYIYLR